MRRWVRRELREVQSEHEAVREERGSLKDLIHDVADVVIQLRVATEDLERALEELAQREEGSDDRPEYGGLGGGGTKETGPGGGGGDRKT